MASVLVHTAEENVTLSAQAARRLLEKGDGDESDCVKQVFEKGYKFKDKIIRYAKVSVTK